MNPRQVDTLPDGFWAAESKTRLYLRVADRGRRRSWVFRFVRGGKVTSMGLGKAGQGGVSLANARDKAEKLNETIKSGVNPLMARRESSGPRRPERRSGRRRKPTSRRRTANGAKVPAPSWRRLLERDIDVIATTPVDTLGREDIKRAVHALYQMTGKGNRKRRPGASAARMLQQRIRRCSNTLANAAGGPKTRAAGGRWSPNTPTAKPSATIPRSCRPKSTTSVTPR